MLSCDVLVVGAGPAGAAAAHAAARNGARVICVERRSEVGVPVQCAEYIPAMLVVQTRLGRDFVVQQTRGMKTFVDGIEVGSMEVPGFIVDRKGFDRCVMEAAIDAGAHLMTATRALEREGEDRVLLRTESGQCLSVKTKVIIGADGPRSTVGRWVGSVNRNLLSAAQVTVPLKVPMDHTEIYFEHQYYAGYGWLFPRGDFANVGIGLKRRPGESPGLRRHLALFVAKLAAQGKIGSQSVYATAGLIPVGPVRKAVYGNVLLAGDAAGQTHPITGAGVFSAVTCGRMAGALASLAAAKGDMKLLMEYEDKWRDLLEDTLNIGYERRQIMEAHWEDRFPRIIESCWMPYRADHG